MAYLSGYPPWLDVPRPHLPSAALFPSVGSHFSIATLCTAYRLRLRIQQVASREWKLVKHNMQEAIIPAWVTKDKQRAENLRRIAQVESRMGTVRRDAIGDIGNKKPREMGWKNASENRTRCTRDRTPCSSSVGASICSALRGRYTSPNCTLGLSSDKVYLQIKGFSVPRTVAVNSRLLTTLLRGMCFAATACHLVKVLSMILAVEASDLRGAGGRENQTAGGEKDEVRVMEETEEGHRRPSGQGKSAPLSCCPESSRRTKVRFVVIIRTRAVTRLWGHRVVFPNTSCVC